MRGCGCEVVLAAGGAGFMRMEMVLDRCLPDDVERRRRRRRRRRILVVTSIAMVGALAGLWAITSPSDAWWVLLIALVPIAVLAVLFRSVVRRDRAVEPSAEPPA